MATLNINAGGMHCSSCSMLIEMTLGDLDGVSSSQVDYVKGTATAEYDPAVVSVEQILTAVRDAGYTAEVAA